MAAMSRTGDRKSLIRTASCSGAIRHHGLGHDLGDAPRGARRHEAEHSGPLAGLDEAIREGKAKHDGALALRSLRKIGHVTHGGGTIDPEPDGLGRLPFALAHIEAVVAP